MALFYQLPTLVVFFSSLLNGGFKYHKSGFEVSCVKNFISLMKSSGEEKKRIILANIQSRLDVIGRYETQKFSDFDDDIPF